MLNAYFIHIPKSAGNSIKHAFYNKHLFGRQIKSKFLFDRLHPIIKTFKSNPTPINLKTCILVTSLFHKNIYEEIKNVTPRFCFAFTRNPWDRVVSSYFYLRERNLKEIPKSMTFESFVIELKENWGSDFGGAVVKRQLDFITDPNGNIFVDFLGRYESLQKHFDEVCKIIGIEPITLLITNNTIHDHYTTYYNEKTVKIVEELYEKDIDAFRYGFDTTN